MNILYLGNKRYSSWSLRPWLVAKKSGFPFSEIMLSLQHPSEDTVFQQDLPAHRVPVLQLENGLKIWDSLAILEYFAELNPTLLPQQQDARAVCRSVCAEMHSGFQTLRRQRPMNLGWLNQQHPPLTFNAELDRDVQRIFELWTDCKTRFGQQGSWLFGDFSLADAMFAPVALRFAIYSITQQGVVDEYITHWLEDIDLQKWIQAAHTETERVTRFEQIAS